MIRPLSLFIGLRYTRAKRRNHFISFISLASMLGIALGVMVLITVLSVMNGFDYQIQTRFFAIAPEVTVMTTDSVTKDWPKLAGYINQLPKVRGVAPYVSGQGMVLHAGQFNGLEVMGILPGQEGKISKLPQNIVAGKLSSLQSGKYNIILGQSLAAQLGVHVGSKITLLTPQSTVTLAGVFPRYRTFTVSGVFHAGSGFGFEKTYAFINLYDAARLFEAGQGNGQATSGFHVKLHDLYQAGLVTQELARLLPPSFSISNWTTQFGAFFSALSMEKNMLFIILLLIVAVAAFNLVSSLVMVVHEKRSEIAILRTLGASPGLIMRTFIIQGAIVGLMGTVLGVVLGLLLAANATAIVNAIQHTFHVQFISSSVYFVNYLPSRIQVGDVVMVACIAFGLSLLATLYPAFVAFRTQPAEALRYE